jgi:hypothetical protein
MNKIIQFIELVLFIGLPIVGVYLQWLAVTTYFGQRTNQLFLLVISFIATSLLVIYCGDLFLLRVCVAGILQQGWKCPLPAIFCELIALMLIPGTLVALFELLLLRLSSKLKYGPIGQKQFKTFLLLFLANLLIGLPIGWHWLIQFARDILCVPH